MDQCVTCYGLIQMVIPYFLLTRSNLTVCPPFPTPHSHDPSLPPKKNKKSKGGVSLHAEQDTSSAQT